MPAEPANKNAGDEAAVERLLSVIANDIVPLTRAAVRRGNKVFGAAILRKDDLSLVVAGTNNETENPLWHGEVHTLKLFYEIAADQRPATKDCIFVTTHEPCSLCLSAITWSGFDNFYYLFGYTDTDELFKIPHDLKILQEVFGIRNGNYVRQNAFWTGHSLVEMIEQLPEHQCSPLRARISELAMTYGALSTSYQSTKQSSEIPLA